MHLLSFPHADGELTSVHRLTTTVTQPSIPPAQCRLSLRSPSITQSRQLIQPTLSKVSDAQDARVPTAFLCVGKIMKSETEYC